MDNLTIIEKLKSGSVPEKQELAQLLETITDSEKEVLKEAAQKKTQSIFSNKVYIRGLIEISSYCKNDCLYCGLRRSNKNAVRYRLSKEQILSCCENGHRLVSLGERGYQSYKRLYDAGADRYLLRHETANALHYSKLHPKSMSFETRKSSLFALKEIGYQTGAGFMVGSPWQTYETLAEDLLFIKELQPQMCGIGPFIPHKDTPFFDKPSGTLEMTLVLLSIIRLLHPHVLLPATTALGTIHPKGRELGILHGANVVMPNLSPAEHRKDYSLYDNKICTGDEAAECIRCLSGRMKLIGYEIVTDRGDYK